MENEEVKWTELDELELESLEKKNQSLKKIKLILIILFVSITTIFIYGVYILYPFNFKIDGTWVDSETQKYIVENHQLKSTFTVKDIDGNQGMSLVYEGKLVASGTNRYRSKDNMPFIKIEKKYFSEEYIETLKKSTDMYEYVNEDNNSIIFKYTKKAKEIAFPNGELEDMFYFELKPSYIMGDEKVLKLRNSSFSENTIIFNKISSK